MENVCSRYCKHTFYLRKRGSRQVAIKGCVQVLRCLIEICPSLVVAQTRGTGSHDKFSILALNKSLSWFLNFDVTAGWHRGPIMCDGYGCDEYWCCILIVYCTVAVLMILLWCKVGWSDCRYSQTFRIGLALTLIRMTKDEKGLAFFKGLLL
jgi:hypothetical protein